MGVTRAEATKAVQNAIEARQYAHARAAYAYACLASTETDQATACALAHAARSEIGEVLGRARASPSIATLVEEAHWLIAGIRGEPPDGWQATARSVLSTLEDEP